MKILPVHSISKIPVIHKRNGIIDELHKAKKIVSNFDIQIKSIINKYTGTGFFSRFARSTINHFDSGKDNLTVWNGKIRWNEHADKNSKSEPANNLKENPTHKLHGTLSV